MKSIFAATAGVVLLTAAAQAQAVPQPQRPQNQTAAAATIEEKALGPAQPQRSTTGSDVTGSIAYEQGQCHQLTVRKQEQAFVTIVRTFFRCD